MNCKNSNHPHTWRGMPEHGEVVFASIGGHVSQMCFDASRFVFIVGDVLGMTHYDARLADWWFGSPELRQQQWEECEMARMER